MGSSTATPRTSLASSPRSRRRLTAVPASPPRTTLSSSSPVTPPSCCSPPASPCASSPSPTTLLSEGSLSVTLGRPWLWASSRPPPPRWWRAARPRPPRRPTRRNEMLPRGSYSSHHPHMGQHTSTSPLFYPLLLQPFNPGARNVGGFSSQLNLPRLACTSIARSFSGYTIYIQTQPLLSCPDRLFTLGRPIW